MIEALIDARKTPLNIVEISPLAGVETRVPASMGVISLDVRRAAKSGDLGSIESTREYHVNSYMAEELACIASFSRIQEETSWFCLRCEIKAY
ncbi:hypothetical protein ACLOJK_020307 [Asimina triloba]